MVDYRLLIAGYLPGKKIISFLQGYLRAAQHNVQRANVSWRVAK